MSASRNRSVTLTEEEQQHYQARLLAISAPVTLAQVKDRILCQDMMQALPLLPPASVDLLILDPPYKLRKNFGGETFNLTSDQDYAAWLESWLAMAMRLLKPTASVYMCGDWRNGALLYQALQAHLIIRNRITWEREKGRGAKANWKNSSEDIWFCTVGENYTFNIEAVKLKRKVLAPYRNTEGKPKDWQAEKSGNYRLTYPSNLWTDISIPFWSMPENTEHPTQKPEKLLAKLILASSNKGDLILDPFVGVGSSAVVAQKLGRSYIGIEQNLKYACLAEKRLSLAADYPHIQGYQDGVFWERNTKPSRDSAAE